MPFRLGSGSVLAGDRDTSSEIVDMCVLCSPLPAEYVSQSSSHITSPRVQLCLLCCEVS